MWISPFLSVTAHGKFKSFKAPLKISNFLNGLNVLNLLNDRYLKSPVLCPRLVQDAFSPADVEHPAAAESRHRARDFRRAAAIFLDPIDHLFGEIGGDHAVTAHGRELKNGGVGQAVHAPAKAQRVFYAMTGNPGVTATTGGIFNGRADVHRDA